MGSPRAVLKKRTPRAEPSSRLTRQDWIDGAVRKLAEDSVAALRVDELADSLNVTKGSFYWHFKSREDLLDAVLAWWRNLMTSEIQGVLSRTPVPETDRIAQLLRIGLSARADVPGGPFELTLREWARREPHVARVIQEVDQARLSFVAGLYREAGLDTDSAQDYAYAHMAFVIGARTAFASGGPAEVARQRRIAKTFLLPGNRRRAASA